MRPLLALILLMAPPGLACTFPDFDGVTVSIRGDRLIAMAGDNLVGRVDLPVLDRDWGCLEVHPFPEYGEFFVNWDQGVSGTDVTLRRRTLLSFRLDGQLSELRRWTLFKSSQDATDVIVQTDQTYRLIRTPYGVRVILESG